MKGQQLTYTVEELLETMQDGHYGMPPWTDEKLEMFCKERGAFTLADAFRLGRLDLASQIMIGKANLPVTITKKEEKDSD